VEHTGGRGNAEVITWWNAAGTVVGPFEVKRVAGTALPTPGLAKFPPRVPESPHP